MSYAQRSCTERGNTDITELVVIDEMTRCEASKEHNANENLSAHVDQFCLGCKQKTKKR